MSEPRVYRPNTKSPEERARERELRERLQRERPAPEELIASGEYNRPVPFWQYVGVREFATALKHARLAAGLTLAEAARLSGLDKAVLSKLETAATLNPTLSTLLRYAHALGRRLRPFLEVETGEGTLPGKAIVEPPRPVRQRSGGRKPARGEVTESIAPATSIAAPAGKLG